VADVADVSAVDGRAAEDAGIVAALVINIGTPGILNPVRSPHLLDVCAQAIGASMKANQ
jgi:hypothetical protein